MWLADVDARAVSQAAHTVGGQSLALDVTSEAAWSAGVARIKEEAGGVDVLVNAAGVSRTPAVADILEADLEGWRRVFAVNVEGVMLGCRAVAPLMAGRGGAIVNVSSTTAISPTPTLGAYGASKAAVLQVTRSVAAACAIKGWPIRCNVVMPGMTATPMTAGMPDAARAAWEALAAYSQPPTLVGQPVIDLTLGR